MVNKNKKTKLASLALALALSSAAVGPAFADTASPAQEGPAYEYNIEAETPEELKAEARDLKESLLDVGPFAPYLKVIDKIIDILNSFDIKSSGPRLNLASDSLEAILVATRDLTNKTETTHRNIGFAVTRAVIVLADPFASTDKIASASENLKEVISQAKESPDITENDIATVYKKQKLNKLIAEAKNYRLHNLGNKEYKAIRDELNKAIKTKLTNRVSVGEIDKAYEELEATLNQVKEERIPIAQEIEAKEALNNAKNKANKELAKARGDQKVTINKVKDATGANKGLAKKEVDKIFNQARADIKEAESIEDVENIKNIALENIAAILPAIEVPEEPEVPGDTEEPELPEEGEEGEVVPVEDPEDETLPEEEVSEELPAEEAIDEVVVEP
jgi:hypothetical protein